MSTDQEKSKFDLTADPGQVCIKISSSSGNTAMNGTEDLNDLEEKKFALDGSVRTIQVF